MKVLFEGDAVVGVELTRRNLEALLAKLNGDPPNSACTLMAPGPYFRVTAVENEAHYAQRAPGGLHPDTEAKVG